MRTKAFFVLCLSVLMLGLNAFAPKGDKTNEFIVCIVHGDYDLKKGIEIAKEFKEKQVGVSMSRLDANSKKFFIIFEKDKVSRDNVIDFFAARNMKATCLHTGVHGVDAVPDMNAAECK